MSSPLSPSAQKLNTHLYMNFAGMDTSAPATILENGENQPLVLMRNCYADWRGIINLDRPLSQVSDIQRKVIHVRHFTPEAYCYAHRGDSTTSLFSSLGHEADSIFPKNAVVSTAVFKGITLFACAGEAPVMYNGATFKSMPGATHGTPAYVTAIQNRLVWAGMPGATTKLYLGRANEVEYFPGNETEQDTNVLKAAEIDLANNLDTGDTITGIAAMDSVRLAVFTNDRAFVYLTHPSYLQWALDGNTSVNVGTISHNSIARAGADLFFCSRSGVHSMRRSTINGITTYTLPMSERVRTTYLALLKRVPNKQDISACYDQDNGQYHIFFPGAATSTRLTATVSPLGSENGELSVKWSVSDFLNPQCGDFFGGSMLYGTPVGVFAERPENTAGADTPPLEIVTPVMWLKDGSVLKEITTFILQAEGVGDLTIVARNELGVEIGHLSIELNDEIEDGIFAVPVLRQQSRKFEYRVRGIQFQVTSQSAGHIRIVAFALTTRK